MEVHIAKGFESIDLVSCLVSHGSVTPMSDRSALCPDAPEVGLERTQLPTNSELCLKA